MLAFLNLLLISCVTAIGFNEIPLVKTKSGNYYLSLRIGGHHQPRTDFYIDFNSTISYIDASVFPHLKVNHNHSLQVLSPKERNFGFMNFTVLPTNISWIQYKGILGLGLNSDFILMLQRTLKKNISLRIQIISKVLVIQGKQCRNPQTGPFKIQLATWTKVSYLTPLSLNFEPSLDFLALLNKSTNNFQMNTDDYHQKLLTVSYQDQQRSIKIKRFIDCWKLDKSDDYQCKSNTSSTPDVGLALFSFPVKVCKNGVDIGVTIIPTQSYYTYFLILIVANIVLGIIFLARKRIQRLFKSDQPNPPTSSLIQQ